GQLNQWRKEDYLHRFSSSRSFLAGRGENNLGVRFTQGAARRLACPGLFSCHPFRVEHQAEAAAPMIPASLPVTARKIGSCRCTSDQMCRLAAVTRLSQYIPPDKPKPPPTMNASGSRVLIKQPTPCPTAAAAEVTTSFARL